MDFGRKSLLGIVFASIMFFTCGQAFGAAIISKIDPLGQDVNVGDTVEVTLGLSELVPETVITGFEFNISFDDSILAYNGFTFAPDLIGAANAGGLLDNSLGLTPGVINFDVSNFNLVAPADFNNPVELIQFNFTAIDISNATEIGFDENATQALSGLLGSPVNIDYQIASIAVVENPVPIPGAALLLGSGLFGFSFIRRRK